MFTFFWGQRNRSPWLLRNIIMYLHLYQLHVWLLEMLMIAGAKN